MRLVQVTLAGLVVSLLVACGGLPKISFAPVTVQQVPTNKDKIVGTWELTFSSDPAGVPPGTTFEFTRDGKFKPTVTLGGQRVTGEGTYTVDGDNLETTSKRGFQEVKVKYRIVNLTDTQLKLEGVTGLAKQETLEFKKK